VYLSNLTLFGFKSFIDRLHIDFQPGMTALVGPNGCGKSNVLDAIRWVLGEQSAKALRGDRMEDMIFAGNTHRKSVGMAEVSLTLSDVNGQLAVPYEEVTITRRLYRSGESEYLLNHQPCRLKDVTRLFLDTGLGREPYALIEQGRIGSLLNLRPVDRRALLEEAAGIMSYKVNRNTALARLQAAEQNLFRVKDVLHEIERQRNSLHRQAKKAERYQRLSLRLKEIQALLLFQEDRRLQEELHRVTNQEKQFMEARELCQLRVSTEETSLETGRLQDLHLEKRITAAQELLYTLRSQRERGEAEVRSRESQLHDLRRRSKEQREELALTADRLDRLQQDFEADAKMRDLAAEELAEAARRLRDVTEVLTGLEGELRQSEEILQQQKREILGLADRLVSRRNHVASLLERHRLLHQERETLDRQLTASRVESETVGTRDRDLTSRLQDLESKSKGLAKERDAISRELTTLQVRQEALADRRAALRAELSGRESRLDSLRELEATLAGLNEGHQFLLKGKAAGVAACQAIEGSLSGGIRVEAAWEKAIEALLGDLQQGLLTPTAADAISLIHYLEQEGTGWATLLPRQREWSAAAQQTSSLDEALRAVKASLDPDVAERIVGPAVRVVKAAKDVQPLLHTLLEDAVVVQDLPTALLLLQEIPSPIRVATVSGTVLSSRGPIQGGNTTTLNLLSRRRELEELPAVIARATEELQALDAEWEQVQEALADRRHAARVQEQAFKETEDARHEIERSLAEVHTVTSRLGSHLAFLMSEGDRLEEELGELEVVLKSAQSDVDAWQREEDTLRENAAQCDRRVALLRARQQELHAEVAEIRIRSTSLHERKEALARSLERLEADIARERSREAEVRQEEDESRSREGRLAQEIAALKDSLGAVSQQEIREAQAVQELQHERDGLRHTLLTHDEALKASRKEVADIQQQQASTATRRAALSTERTLIQKRLQEEFPERDTLPQAVDDGGDPAQTPELLTQESEEIRQKIATMGPINMAALEEYEALSERHRFLTGQAEDLKASVTSLRATIVEINRTIKNLFNETLTAVNEHLNRFWQRLFGGGEAELVPSEEGDTEEPGVEIRVRIPGKRTTTLSLLSGGEKTLGAIALLMALWATKPSPFVVLDEVDAALDDPNIDRFASLLRDLATTSQFILVTHHPRTIEMVDLLYGVTMEEPGVSRLISVRLGQQMEQPATATAS
jgi:chromosome segregation protein